MTDIDIIRLLWIRDEIAIEELEINYGHYCRQISWEIVQNREDVSECLNDTWWKTWCSIPENRPDSLRAYVARITRNLSLNKIIHNKAWKRGYGKISVIEQEVGDLIDRSDDFRASILVYGDTTGNCKAYGFKGKKCL